MNWEKQIEESVKWVRENRERFWAITGTVLLAVLFVVLLIRNKQKASEEAWFQLGGVQSQLAQGQLEEARKSLAAWDSRYAGGSSASYATFLKADLAYRTSDYMQASQLYGTLAQTGRQEIRPLALSGQIASEEMSGRIPEAQSLAQSFLDKYPDHFLAITVYQTQARLAEIKGDHQAASAIYERISLLFPQSPWAAAAKAKSQTLAQK